MAVDPVRGAQEFWEMSQMKAETKILIYKLVVGAKIDVLSLQRKIKDLGDKCAPLYMESEEIENFKRHENSLSGYRN